MYVCTYAYIYIYIYIMTTITIMIMIIPRLPRGLLGVQAQLRPLPGEAGADPWGEVPCGCVLHRPPEGVRSKGFQASNHFWVTFESLLSLLKVTLEPLLAYLFCGTVSPHSFPVSPFCLRSRLILTRSSKTAFLRFRAHFLQPPQSATYKQPLGRDPKTSKTDYV